MNVEWQNIETAPKDRDILMYCKRAGVVRGRWKDDLHAKTPRPYWGNDREYLFGVRATREDQPTHWTPLLTAPEVLK